MAEQKQKDYQKPFLSGFSAFNLPSVTQFKNMMQDSLKFITTQKNMAHFQKDYITPQKPNPQNQVQEDSLGQRIEQPQLITASSKKKKPGCTCKKTLCLKMYCQCFANNRACTEDCVCCDCNNTVGNQQIIKQARSQVKQKGTHTCSLSEKKCNCKKSFCQKKYCECFNAGVSCTAACKCIDCANCEALPTKKQQSIAQLKEADLPYTGNFLQKSLQNFQKLQHD